jgi:hypothetical protein
MGLRVTGGDAVDGLLREISSAKLQGQCTASQTYPESLEVVNGEGIAVKVKESVLEHASMAVAK